MLERLEVRSNARSQLSFPPGGRCARRVLANCHHVRSCPFVTSALCDSAKWLTNGVHRRVGWIAAVQRKMIDELGIWRRSPK